MLTDIRQMLCRADFGASRHACFISIGIRHDDVVTGLSRVNRGDQHPRGGLQLAIQRELAVALAIL